MLDNIKVWPNYPLVIVCWIFPFSSLLKIHFFLGPSRLYFQLSLTILFNNKETPITSLLFSSIFSQAIRPLLQSDFFTYLQLYIWLFKCFLDCLFFFYILLPLLPSFKKKPQTYINAKTCLLCSHTLGTEHLCGKLPNQTDCDYL